MTNLDKVKQLAFYFFIKSWNIEFEVTGWLLRFCWFAQYFVIVPVALMIDLLVLIISISILSISWLISQFYEFVIKPILAKSINQIIELTSRITTVLIIVVIVILLIYRFDLIKTIVINIFDNLI